MINDHYLLGERLLEYHHSREQTLVFWQKNHEHTSVLRLNPDTPVSHLARWNTLIDHPAAKFRITCATCSEWIGMEQEFTKRLRREAKVYSPTVNGGELK